MSEQQKNVPEQGREVQESEEILRDSQGASSGQPGSVQAAAGTATREELAPAQEFRKNPRKRANAFGQDEPRMASHVQITNQAFIEKLKRKKAEQQGLPEDAYAHAVPAPGGPAVHPVRQAAAENALTAGNGSGHPSARAAAPGQAPLPPDFPPQAVHDEQTYFSPQEQAGEYAPREGAAYGEWAGQPAHAQAQQYAAPPPPPPHMADTPQAEYPPGPAAPYSAPPAPQESREEWAGAQYDGNFPAPPPQAEVAMSAPAAEQPYPDAHQGTGVEVTLPSQWEPVAPQHDPQPHHQAYAPPGAPEAEQQAWAAQAGYAAGPVQERHVEHAAPQRHQPSEHARQEHETATARAGRDIPHPTAAAQYTATGQEHADGKSGAGPEAPEGSDNGGQRVHIPWSDTAVQDLEYGEGNDYQAYQEKMAAYEAEREKAGAAGPAPHFAARSGGREDESSSPMRNEEHMYGGRKGGQAPPEADRGDGAWLWLPQGIEQRRPWRKRHPVLFWGLVILLGAFIFGAGRFSMSDLPVGGTRLAVINLEGVILDAEDVVKWIEKVARDDTCKGALLRINSPGGAVGPSQEIYAAVKRLDAKKPVVAHLGTLAASGGYYAALGAREIVSGPSTITGSIGIKMQVPNVEGLMQTLGVSERTLVSGAYKDAGSVWRKMSKEEEEYFYGIMDDMYEEFVGVVAQERKISMADMGNIADGKAMTGRQALLHKLVDSLGDKRDALSRLKALCRIDENASVVLVEGPRQKGSFLRELLLSVLGMLQEQRSAGVQPMYIY